MWQIDKEFGFDYGHRVWSQLLNPEFATEEQKPICRHLHGHRGNVRVFLESDKLDRGMVTDFHHLNWLKKFLDDYIDHKFIIDVNDPWFSSIIAGKLENFEFITPDGRVFQTEEVFVPETDWTVGLIIDTTGMEGPEQEFYEGFFIVDFVPTSEYLAMWLFNVVQVKMCRINITVSKVEWNETPKSRSVYIGD